MTYLANDGGAEHAASNPLIPATGEVIMTAIGFLILLFIVIKYIAPAFEKIYQDRKEAIEGGLAKAKKVQAEAAAAREEYSQQLDSARLEAQQIREEARAEGEAIIAKARERATAEAQRITENAQKTRCNSVMAGVSTESLSKVEAALDANASLNPLHLASELFAVVDVIDRDGGLRRGLTDTSRVEAARQNIASTVFGSKVSSQTLSVLTVAVSQRWSAERDLADALEKCAVLAAIVSTQSHGGVEALDTLINELLTFVRNVDGTAQAQTALSNNLASKEAKQKLAVALGGPARSAEGVLLLERIGSETRGMHAARLADEFVEIIVKRQNRYIAKVTSAVALSQAQLNRLGHALSRVYNRKLKLDISVDPTVLGGLRVQVGDEVIDGTVIARLDELERNLG